MAISQSHDGVRTEIKVTIGDPREELLALAESTPDSIAVMPRGASGLTRWLRGSVTDSVVRTVAAPTVVVPGLLGRVAADNLASSA